MRSFFAAVAAAYFAASLPAHSSPWNRADSGLFVSTTTGYYSSKTVVSRYSRVDSDTYLEFGATPSWMLGGRVSYGTSFSDSAAGAFTDTGLNQAEIYLQRQIRRGEHSATSVKLSGARSGRLSTDAQSGASAPNMEIELRALHGRDVMLEPFKIFIAGEAGYRRRFGGDADQIRADALVGFEPNSRLLLLLETQSVISLKNEDPGFADFDLHKGQASVIWRRSRRWTFVAGGRKEFAARNIPAGTSFFIGVWSEF